MLLLNLSKNHNIFFMEKCTYKYDRVYKSYIISIDKTTREFKSKKDLLLYLSNLQRR